MATEDGQPYTQAEWDADTAARALVRRGVDQVSTDDLRLILDHGENIGVPAQVVADAYNEMIRREQVG